MSEIMDNIKFDDKGLIPAITQDYITGEVLMLAYMNKESLEKTIETGKVHYFSRSRNSLWLKGETSGHFQNVKSMTADCDKDALLITVEQVEVACHTGKKSCFFNEITKEGFSEKKDRVYSDTMAGVLKEVYDVAVDRQKNPKEGSYTNYLFNKGIDKILKKVGEETAEVIIAAKNNSKDEIKYEISDLLYHLIVLMVERGVSLDDIYNELKGRR